MKKSKRGVKADLNLIVRITPKEKQEIKQAAEIAGKTISDFVRDRVLNYVI